MNASRRFILRLSSTLAAGTLAFGAAGSAFAQSGASWPSHPIVFISGFPGGAATDLYSRKLGSELASRLDVAVVTDTRTGAGGNIASAAVAQAAPDGYTFLLGTAGTHAINASLYKNLPFDVVKDFTPVALLGYLPNVLLVNPEKHPGVQTCQDLMTLIRERPGELNYASTGNGASGHLAGVQFLKAANLAATHVPYRGQGPAMTALLSREIDFFFNQSSPSIPVVQSGKARALGVTAAQSIAALPEVPTIADACGLPGFDSTTWYGLFAPAGLPDGIRNTMANEVLAITQSPGFKEWLVSQGIAPVEDGSPATFARVQQDDITKWADIVKASGATLD